jgi:hypothetical protein
MAWSAERMMFLLVAASVMLANPAHALCNTTVLKATDPDFRPAHNKLMKQVRNHCFCDFRRMQHMHAAERVSAHGPVRTIYF